MTFLPLGPNGGKDIICEKDSEKYYVECKSILLITLYHHCRLKTY